MIELNEVYTVKNLQYILDMTDIVILYHDDMHAVRFVGLVKDLPLEYLHSKIKNIYTYNVSLPDRVGATVYI